MGNDGCSDSDVESRERLCAPIDEPALGESPSQENAGDAYDAVHQWELWEACNIDDYETFDQREKEIMSSSS